VWIHQVHVISATQTTVFTIELRNMLYKLNSLPGIYSNKKTIRMQRTRLQISIISERIKHITCYR